MAPTYERTELVRTRTSLAHAKNRIDRFLAQAEQARQHVADLEQKIIKLQKESN